MTATNIELNDLARAILGASPHPSRTERRAALSVFRELALGHPVEIGSIAGRAGSNVSEIEDFLVDQSGVSRDELGRVVGFCGLGLEPTRHRIELGGRTVYAWCAWDALFLGDLLGQELRVESACAGGGPSVRLRAGPDGVRDLQPEQSVISFVEPECCHEEPGVEIPSFCRQVLFFSSRERWSRWAAGRSPAAFTLTVEQGWRLGRLVNEIRYGDDLGAHR